LVAGLSKLLASRIDRGKFETKFIRGAASSPARLLLTWHLVCMRVADEKEDSDIAKRGVKLGALLASRCVHAVAGQLSCGCSCDCPPDSTGRRVTA
jgi:hypothetical protein